MYTASITFASFSLGAPQTFKSLAKARDFALAIAGDLPLTPPGIRPMGVSIGKKLNGYEESVAFYVPTGDGVEGYGAEPEMALGFGPKKTYTAEDFVRAKEKSGKKLTQAAIAKLTAIVQGGTRRPRRRRRRKSTPKRGTRRRRTSRSRRRR